MLFSNSFDIANYVALYRSHPVLSRAARMLAAVAHDADYNSDGWHSWPLPCRAARSLQVLLQRGTATEAEYQAALRPIKAFYTRMRTKGANYPTMPVLSGEDNA